MAVERRVEADWPHWPGRPRGTQRRERLERRLFSATAPTVRSAPHLLFVATAQGYVLIAGTGDPSGPGDVVRLDDGDYLVTKVGRSPLPGDERPCAFLERC